MSVIYNTENQGQSSNMQKVSMSSKKDLSKNLKGKNKKSRQKQSLLESKKKSEQSVALHQSILLQREQQQRNLLDIVNVLYKTKDVGFSTYKTKTTQKNQEKCKTTQSKQKTYINSYNALDGVLNMHISKGINKWFVSKNMQRNIDPYIGKNIDVTVCQKIIKDLIIVAADKGILLKDLSKEQILMAINAAPTKDIDMNTKKMSQIALYDDMIMFVKSDIMEDILSSVVKDVLGKEKFDLKILANKYPANSYTIKSLALNNKEWQEEITSKNKVIADLQSIQIANEKIAA